MDVKETNYRQTEGQYFDKKINEHKTALEKFTGLKDHLEYEASK